MSLTEADGRLMVEAAIDAIGAVQERYLDARLECIEVRVTVLSAGKSRTLSVIKERS